MTEIEKQAAELGTALNAIKRNVADNDGKIVDMSAKISAVQEIVLRLQQATEAEHRAMRDRSAAGGTNRDLDTYVAKSDSVTSENRASMLRNDAGVVQLTGVNRTELVNGGADVVRSWQWGILDDPNPRSEAQLRLQRAVQARSIARSLLEPSRCHTPRLDLEVRQAARACGGSIEKIFADSAGIGAEWVPDTLLPELERDVMIPTNFAALFPQRILAPGTSRIPNRTGRIRVRKGGVPTTNNPADAVISTWTTGNNALDAVQMYAAAQVDRDFEEDSIIAILPEIAMEMANAFRYSIDDAIVNGDSNATHQDAIASWDGRGELGGTSGLGGTDDHRRAWLGLRARAYDLTSMTTDQTAAKTFAGLQTALGKLGAKNLMRGYATAGDVIVAPSWEYFFGVMLQFAEFATWEKVGSLASVLTGRLGQSAGPGGMLPGQVGFLQGFIPVCIPFPLSSDLAATGLYTGSGTTTGMLQFDRSRFEFCVRQGMRFETARRIENNTVTAVARGRYLFRSKDAVASTIKDVHYSFNL